MTKEELMALGLSEEQTGKVLVAQTKEWEQAVAGEKTRADGLQEQLAQRDKDLAGLKKKASGSEELEQQLADLQKKYGDEKKAMEEQLSAVRFNAALETELVRAKARDTAAVRAMLQEDKLQLGADGTLSGLAEQLQALQQEKGWAFETNSDGPQTRTNYEPKSGETSEPTMHFDFVGVRPIPKE